MAVTTVTWRPSFGLQGRLVRTPEGTWRTAHPAQGVGAHGIYHRHASVEKFEPPYILSGRIKVHDRLDDPWIEVEQRRPTWKWGVTFHPCYPSNANNWGVGSSPDAKHTSLYTELGDGYNNFTWRRPGSIYRGPPMPLYDGGWHSFVGVVATHGSVEWYVDGVLHASGVEAVPSFDGANAVAFRLDFHDVELADVQVEHRGSNMQTAELLEFVAGDIDPIAWGVTTVVRGLGPARRVNQGELPRLRSVLGPARRLSAGTWDHWWVAAEIAAYDDYVKSQFGWAVVAD